MCDPMWNVNSSSGVATSVSEMLYPYVLLYLRVTETACLKLIFAKFARSVKKVPIRRWLHGDVRVVSYNSTWRVMALDMRRSCGNEAVEC